MKRVLRFGLACLFSLPFGYTARICIYSCWRWRTYDYFEDWAVAVLSGVATLVGVLAVWAILYREREEYYD